MDSEPSKQHMSIGCQEHPKGTYGGVAGMHSDTFKTLEWADAELPTRPRSCTMKGDTR